MQEPCLIMTHPNQLLSASLFCFCLSMSTCKQVDKVLCILPTSQLPWMSCNLWPAHCNTTFDRIPWLCSRIPAAGQVEAIISAEPSFANGPTWRIEVGVCMSGLRGKITLPLFEPTCHLFLLLQTEKIHPCQCALYATPWMKASAA